MVGTPTPAKPLEWPELLCSHFSRGCLLRKILPFGFSWANGVSEKIHIIFLLFIKQGKEQNRTVLLDISCKTVPFCLTAPMLKAIALSVSLLSEDV
jgi:hypothetical protein